MYYAEICPASQPFTVPLEISGKHNFNFDPNPKIGLNVTVMNKKANNIYNFSAA